MKNQPAFDKDEMETTSAQELVELVELDFAQAKKRVAQWISKRDFSEFELKEKLARYTNSDVISATINWCHDLKLIPLPEVMTEFVIDSLNRQKKGIQQINQMLESKGLAEVSADDVTELSKANILVNKKMSESLRSTPWKELSQGGQQKTKAKVFRFLATRGFTSEIINSSFEKWLVNNKETDVYENE